MDILRQINLEQIERINILNNVNVSHQLSPEKLSSTENLSVHFNLSGEINGSITCFLCLDKEELTPSEKNYIFPLFVESMNILVGKQISSDVAVKRLKVKLSSPKLSMISKNIDSLSRKNFQKYELELENRVYQILIEYNLEALN